MFRLIPLAFAVFFALTTCAMAASRRVDLRPGETAVGFRAYGLGLLPLDGEFTRFVGLLEFDPADHAKCRVDLRVEVSSLAMPDAAVRDTIIGPDFMDAAAFPTLKFTGACQAAGIAGLLDLHGVTRPFALALTWRPDSVVAAGELRRAEWGMTAMRFLAGQTVRITVSVPLPGP